MKLALTCIAALLLQAGNFSGTRVTVASLADPQHLRYERVIKLPKDASGTACAILDASVFAHAASSSADDLRIFQNSPSKSQQEIPFTVSYSAAQPTDATTATVGNVAIQNDVLNFDLAMPRRSYTSVELKLAANNFIGTAEITGSDGRGSTSVPLGTLAIFDLTQQHLARSTALALPESSFAELHVRLRLHSIDGGPLHNLSPTMVQGATVPPSREAQTLYTVVALSRDIVQQYGSTIIKLRAAAHVPVEQIHFDLNPAYKGDFLRQVAISATSDAQDTASPWEMKDGDVWRVARNADASGDPSIHAEKLAVTAVLASNLRDPAKVRVNVKNDGQPPLPIEAVELEMRQRTLCFRAAPGATYMLRYGDDALLASVYDLDGLRDLAAKPVVATLGTEELNRRYVGRNQIESYKERNPQIYWIALMAAIAALGAVASRHTKHRGRHR